MDTIFQRRSVRKFLEKKISEEDIKRILRAGMAAPSCKASCEWVFVVMRDRERFQKFLEVHPYATALKTADTVILVCADLNLEKEPGEGWWIQDCSAAMQNMLLEATDLGLGSLAGCSSEAGAYRFYQGAVLPAGSCRAAGHGGVGNSCERKISY